MVFWLCIIGFGMFVSGLALVTADAGDGGWIGPILIWGGTMLVVSGLAVMLSTSI